MFWTGPWRFARLAMAALAMIAGLLATTPETAKAAPYAAFVMDARTGEVLHTSNADRRLHPASLTKMMTLYLAFEALETLLLEDDSPYALLPNDPAKLHEMVMDSFEIVLKGIQTAEDAVLAAEHGVDGIVCSNHGGRQLDNCIAPLTALPEIVKVVDEVNVARRKDGLLRATTRRSCGQQPTPQPSVKTRARRGGCLAKWRGGGRRHAAPARDQLAPGDQRRHNEWRQGRSVHQARPGRAHAARAGSPA